MMLVISSIHIPGGRALIKSQIGKDASVSFYGGVHDHNTAAHNMLAMMRVAICKYGGEVEHLKKRLGTCSNSNSDIRMNSFLFVQ